MYERKRMAENKSRKIEKEYMYAILKEKNNGLALIFET